MTVRKEALFSGPRRGDQYMANKSDNETKRDFDCTGLWTHDAVAGRVRFFAIDYAHLHGQWDSNRQPLNRHGAGLS